MKYALVTGGSRGIGRAVCVKLACMGYYVIVNCINNLSEALKTLELIRVAGQDGEIMMFDVSNGEQVRKTIGEWQDAHPDCYIEVLVNNAGISEIIYSRLCRKKIGIRYLILLSKVFTMSLSSFYNL